MAAEEGLDGSFVEDGNRNFGQNPGPVKLTEEEIAVLKDCRRQSLYYRGLPLGIISALVTRQVAHSGYFPRVARWSGLFYSGAFMFGVISGVASYRRICMEKIMRLENSVLADQFRDFQERRKAMIEGRKVDPERQHRQHQPSSYSNDQEPYQPQYDPDAIQTQATEKPRYKPPSQRGRSYEDLRMRHRMNQSVPSQRPLGSNEPQRSEHSEYVHRQNSRPSGQSYSNNDEDKYVNRTNSYQQNRRRDDANENTPLPYVDQEESINVKRGFKKTNQYGDPID